MVLIICIVALVIIGWPVSGFLYVSWGTHLSMTTDDKRIVAHRISFDQFLDEHAKHAWERKHRYPTSYFDYSTDSKIHANIIQFNGQRFFFGPWGWFRFITWQNENALPKISALEWD